MKIYEQNFNLYQGLHKFRYKPYFYVKHKVLAFVKDFISHTVHLEYVLIKIYLKHEMSEDVKLKYYIVCMNSLS